MSPTKDAKVVTPGPVTFFFFGNKIFKDDQGKIKSLG